MRGEPNKKWNKRVTRPCPVCGGRVIVAHRNQSWWISCDEDPYHIKYKPYEDPYSAIRAFNARTNADRIRSMSDEELANYLIRGVEAEAVRRSGRYLTAGEIDRAVNDCVSWLKKPGR